jgi:hypothetical protein
MITSSMHDAMPWSVLSSCRIQVKGYLYVCTYSSTTEHYGKRVQKCIFLI